MPSIHEINFKISCLSKSLLCYISLMKLMIAMICVFSLGTTTAKAPETITLSTKLGTMRLVWISGEEDGKPFFVEF